MTSELPPRFAQPLSDLWGCCLLCTTSNQCCWTLPASRTPWSTTHLDAGRRRADRRHEPVLQLLFGQRHAKNPRAVEMARALGRTPGSPALQLTHERRHRRLQGPGQLLTRIEGIRRPRSRRLITRQAIHSCRSEVPWQLSAGSEWTRFARPVRPTPAAFPARSVTPLRSSVSRAVFSGRQCDHQDREPTNFR